MIEVACGVFDFKSSAVGSGMCNEYTHTGQDGMGAGRQLILLILHDSHVYTRVVHKNEHTIGPHYNNFC
jgi:hypothetical protein